ncbi:MAG: DUF4863 family protein [Myxococcales bacterium]|nr:DUF4863 family protein [Myxococcales bacterium]
MTAEGIETLHEALAPVLSVVARIDPSDPSAKAKLDAELPLQGPVLEKLRQVVRAGVDARWLADREADGVRWSRVKKAASPGELSIDCVNMDRPGPGHTHPNGEIDLCFRVGGDPRFDGHPEGWTVYPPGSWHVPSVSGGVMDILYFLPGGAIRFEPEPASAAAGRKDV